MTTHELTGAARATGDLDTRKMKAVGLAAGALMALGGIAAAAVSTTDRGAAARDRVAPPAPSTHVPNLSSARVRGPQGAAAAAEAIRQNGNGYWATYGNGAVIANSPAPVLGDEA